MFFEGSGTFEQFPAKHLILKNQLRKTTKKTIIFTITSGLCYAFLIVCNYLIEDELLLLRHQSRTSRY